MKKILVCMLAALMLIMSLTTAFAAADLSSTKDQIGSDDYTVVSVVVNKSYDFKDDFHDSYPYDEDFCTEGIFRMRDHEPDVTLTLKENSTGEEFVFEKNSETVWYVDAEVDYLLYETAQIDAALVIEDLGGDYGITDAQVPVTVTVVSSLYSADFHKYPSYIANTSMKEGESFTVDYDASSSDGKATITVLKLPHIFILEIYNVETRQTEYYDDENGNFEFEKEIEITDYDPSRKAFWFFVPCTLVMEDGYRFEFILSVDARTEGSSETEAAGGGSVEPEGGDRPFPGQMTRKGATMDCKASTSDSKKSTDGNAVKTGDPMAAFVLAIAALIAAAALVLYGRKKNSAC